MTIDFAAQRIKMVDGQVRTTGVTDAALISALLSVPRELFVPQRKQGLAYIDEDLEVAPNRFLMEPSPFAKLVQLAEVAPGDRVLHVGCATGYGSAVLSQLAESVTALESDAELAALARSVLSASDAANVAVVVGPLASGWPTGAPYDVVLIEGAVEVLPEALTGQLAEGGRLVAVEGRGLSAVARLTLKSAGVAAGRRAFNAAVKPLPGFDRVHAFEF